MITKAEQYIQFTHFVLEHIDEYVRQQYDDFPDKTVKKLTPEKIQMKLEAYVDRIGKSFRGPEDALRDALKISHWSCYLYAILKHGDAQANLFLNSQEVDENAEK